MVGLPRALTIAGSDSGGGAGIQADLKTFAALGVHGMSAITALTAQNTKGVTAVQAVDPQVVRAQIEAVVDDIGVDAAKTGMLYSSEIITVVAETLRKYSFPLVVDPVMIAKSGAALLQPDAMETLIDRLLPLAKVLTPNRPEAEALSKIRIQTVADARSAAEKIAKAGPKAVVVKGGHVASGYKVVDVLYFDGQFKEYEAPRIDTKNTHGTGCVFASATAAELAKGKSVPEAVGTAREFVTQAIRFSLSIGKGFGPVDPVAQLHRDRERYWVLEELRKAVEILERSPQVAVLSPESQINLAAALTRADSYADVGAIPGRIVNVNGWLKASAPPEFGASRHVANAILAAMAYDHDYRAAINIRYSDEILGVCKRMGLTISSYDRRLEPTEVKKTEGMTTRWGAEHAIKQAGRVPDLIYHDGDQGKEPMIVVFGRTAIEVAKRAVDIAAALTKPNVA